MSFYKTTSITDVFIPQVVFAKFTTEETMCLASQLMIAVIEKTTSEINGGNFEKSFDPNAGDCSCEKQAITIINLLNDRSIKEEAQELVEIAKKINEAFQLRFTGKKQGKPQNFFKEQFGNVNVSEGMAYLLRACLLTVTKVLTEEGSFESDPDEMIDFVAEIKKIDTPKLKSRFKIINYTQECLSKSSHESIKKIAQGLIFKNDEEKTSVLSMFEIDAMPTIKSSRSNRYVSSGFHNMQVVLQFAKETQTPILLKRQIKTSKDKPLTLFLKATSQDKPFVCLTKKEMEFDSVTKPILVMEGDIPNHIADEDLKEKINRVGFEDLILSNMAQNPPFGSDSDETQIKDTNEQNKIFAFQKKAKEIDCVKGKNPFFFIDHVYCNNVKYELGETP